MKKKVIINFRVNKKLSKKGSISWYNSSSEEKLYNHNKVNIKC